MKHKEIVNIVILIILSLVLFVIKAYGKESMKMTSQITGTVAQESTTKIFIPIVRGYPIPTKSHYMNITELDFDPFTLGETDAGDHQSIIQSGRRIIIILSWGQPCSYSDTSWGVYAYDNSCHALSEIQSNTENYIDGYCRKM